MFYAHSFSFQKLYFYVCVLGHINFIIRITDFGEIFVREEGGIKVKIKFTAQETCVLCTSLFSYNRIQ